MSVNSNKCRYDAKFLPLVKQMQSQGPELFMSFLQENFEDADQLYNRFMGNINYDSSPSPVEEVEHVDNRLGLKLNTEVSNSSEFYIGVPGRHRNMLRGFKSRMIENSVFNRNTNTFIDANSKLGEFTLLNQLIFNYKVDLLNSLVDFLNDPTLQLDTTMISLNPDQLTKLSNNIIAAFEAAINKSDLDKTSKFYDAYDSYVVYSKFDKLIAEQVPFIQVNPELKNTNSFYVDKYTYRGPNVQHYTGFSTNEHMSADEHASDLSKILLDYFPEINENGQEIENTAITLSGFNSVMTKLVSAIQNTPQMNDYLPELQRGVKADMVSLLDAYLDTLSKSLITQEAHKTYLQSKIRAIKNYIYNPEMDQYVKDMFTQMAFKTVPASYVAYEYDNTSRQISSKNLKERPISYQRYVIDDLIKASTYYLSNNKEVFNNNLQKYNVKITPSTITFDQIYDDIPTTFTVSYVKNRTGDGYDFKTHGNLSEQTLNDIIYDFMSFIVPDDIDSVSRQIYPNASANWGSQNLFLPLVSTIILASNGDPLFNKVRGLVDTRPYISQITTLANVLSVINGSDTINVIKNAEGNNLPLYQIISLAYNHHGILDRTLQQSLNVTNRNNVGQNNLIFLNNDKNFLLSPKIRSDVTIGKKVKKTSKLTTAEVLRLSIVHDFYQNLTKDLESGEVRTISLQPTTFSDKNKHYLPTYNINVTLHNGVNIKETLDSYFRGDRKALDRIVDTLFESRQNEINALVSNIIQDYSEAFDTTFNTLDDINTFIAKNNLNMTSIQSAFISKGLNFYQDIHAYKAGKETRINETISNYFTTFNDRVATEARLNKEKRKFLKDLLNNNFNLNTTDPVISSLFNEFNNWINGENVVLAKITDSSGKTIDLDSITNLDKIVNNSDWNVELHPVLEAYYITDTLLSNEYNNLMIGGIYAHTNKNREAVTAENYMEHSEASRLISQYKRMVIYGATYHPLAQNLRNGVEPIIQIAVINDDQGTVFNMLGDFDSNLDTMDGSGLVSPFHSRFENNSLLDARVGKDKKTIFHDIDSTYGRPTLLKWAAFELSNERRKFNPLADISIENLFKKMHSIYIGQNIDLTSYFDQYIDEDNTLYFQDWRTGEYYRVDNIESRYENGQLIAERTVQIVDKNGNVRQNSESVDTFTINNIYDLDQLFGGAYAMSYSDKYKNLQFSEANLDIVENIMVGEQIKDKMISYIVNKSAIKVGAGNINSDENFKNSNPLSTITMSTAFGGVQMNADHDLDLSEVTEMTQMISALEQNGYTHALASKIYSDIGKVVAQSMNHFDSAIKSQDKQEVYNILARALINSFMNEDKDTLGLAQSFVALANESLQKSNLDYTLPFSAATINGAFVSTTTSNLVKSGIRRKYAGIGAVLAPSNNMMQYFNIGNTIYTFNELLPIVQARGIQNDINFDGKITRSAIEKAIQDQFINGQLNPFIEQIDQTNIDFEDSIVIYNIAENSYSNPIKIDSFEVYDRIKRNSDPNLQYFNWTIKPKNLKQSNTFFEVIGNDGQQRRFSIYDLDSVRASFYLNSKPVETYADLTDVEIQILNNATGLTSTDPSTPIDKRSMLRLLQFKTQQQLNALESGSFIPTSSAFNLNVRSVKPLNVNVSAAQIVMGKSNASKLGLQPGDTIAQVNAQGANFFYDRMRGNYNVNNSNKSTYDVVLFTGTGKAVYVKIGTESEVSKQFVNYNMNENSDFRVVDNLVYYEGHQLSNVDEKQFYKYTDTDGQSHDVIVINNINRLNELRKSGLFDSYKYNYTSGNVNKLIQFQFENNIKSGRPIKLNAFDALGALQDVTINTLDNQVFDAQLFAANEEIRFDKRLRDISHNKYEAFKKQLNFIGARIPTQSMQSFMPMEVIAFTDSEVNDVYVPKVQTWLQGSDYWANHHLD